MPSLNECVSLCGGTERSHDHYVRRWRDGQRKANSDSRKNGTDADHYVAMALAGKARIRLQEGDL